MNTIFTLGDESSEKMKLNLDDLYERKKQQDLNTLSLYNKILGRIHTKIKTVSRQQTHRNKYWTSVTMILMSTSSRDKNSVNSMRKVFARLSE